MLLPLVLLTSSLSISPALAQAAPSTSQATNDTAADEKATQRMLLKVRIKRGGKTIEHPGEMTETGSEMILVLEEGDRKHEVSVFVDHAKGGYKGEVKYTANGNTVLEEKTKLGNKKWTRISKGKVTVEVFIDTSAKRPDEVEMPGGKDPLDGLK